MKTILAMIEGVLLGIVLVLAIMWVRNPNGNYEPVITVISGVLMVILEIVRRNINESNENKKIEEERRKVIQQIQPIFRASGGQWHEEGGFFEFTNDGEAIKNLRLEIQNKIEATLSPTFRLGRSEKIRIEIKVMPRPRPENFPCLRSR